ncbi:hypothetical protein JOD57_004063 [Geodermatophilus bullaregiensis]|nr:hypothetical protein [Geodermatophilus bullaregiensis]
MGDGALSAILLMAYLSCRGWRAWHQPYRPDVVPSFPWAEPTTGASPTQRDPALPVSQGSLNGAAEGSARSGGGPEAPADPGDREPARGSVP